MLVVSTFLPVQHSIALLFAPILPSFDAFQQLVGSTTLFLAQVELPAAVAGQRVAAGIPANLVDTRSCERR